jgi:hypothetical protein
MVSRYLERTIVAESSANIIHAGRKDWALNTLAGVIFALLAVVSGVLALCTSRISLRLPDSYFKYGGQSVRPQWVNGYMFYRRSSRENWAKATVVSFCASMVVFGVAAIVVFT